MVYHIIERAFLHIMSAGTVYLAAWFLFTTCMRKWRKWTLRITPAVIAAGFIGWREAYDVANGQPLIKAWTDYASWVGGMALAVWLTYRYSKSFRDMLGE